MYKMFWKMEQRKTKERAKYTIGTSCKFVIQKQNGECVRIEWAAIPITANVKETFFSFVVVAGIQMLFIRWCIRPIDALFTLRSCGFSAYSHFCFEFCVYCSKFGVKLECMPAYLSLTVSLCSFFLLSIAPPSPSPAPSFSFSISL